MCAKFCRQVQQTKTKQRNIMSVMVGQSDSGTSYEVVSCAVHRYTLVGGKCFACERDTPGKTTHCLPGHIRQCGVCFRFDLFSSVYHLNRACASCFQCPVCHRQGRMAGLCSFCDTVFCRSRMLTFHDRFPTIFLKLMIAEPGHEFSSLTTFTDSLVERGLIHLIVSYLG